MKLKLGERVSIQGGGSQGIVIEVSETEQKRRYAVRPEKSKFVWMYDEKELRSLDRPHEEEPEVKPIIINDNRRAFKDLDLTIGEDFLSGFR